MKKLMKPILFLLFILSLHSAFCQYRAKEIKSIDHLCKKLENKKWQKIKKYGLLEGDSDTKLYFSQFSLQKIIHTNFGETGKITITYYLINKLIVKVVENEYDYHGNYADTTLNKKETTTEITRSYFQNEKLIHQIGEDCGAPFTQDFLNAETIRLKNRYKKIVQLVKKRS